MADRKAPDKFIKVNLTGYPMVLGFSKVGNFCGYVLRKRQTGPQHATRFSAQLDAVAAADGEWGKPLMML